MRHELLAYCNAGHLGDITESDLKILTGVNIAFGKCNPDNTVKVDHIKDMDQVSRMKRINPAIRVTISLGGALAPGWSNASVTQAGRATLIESTLAFVRRWDLDGVDLDWEFPTLKDILHDARPEDKYTFTLLCREFRKALDRAGREDNRYYSLTMASAGEIWMFDLMQTEQIAPLMDYFQLMTYDLRWQGRYAMGKIKTEEECQKMPSGHHTNLYPSAGDPFGISIERSVNLFRANGVPDNKIVIGSALYAKKWRNVGPQGNGLLQVQTQPTGEEYASEFNGSNVNNYINKNGYTRYWDEAACAPYLYSEAERTFITYDDAQSIACKVEYMKREGLRGIMYWEYSCDSAHALTRYHYDALYNK